MQTGTMLRVIIPSLKPLQERFAKLRQDGFQEIMLAEAEDLAVELQQLYQADAPKQTGEFAARINAVATPTPLGFQIEVSTSQGVLALWLREGTGIYGPTREPIVPANAGALAFEWGGQQMFLRSVQGMNMNPWEEEASREAMGLSLTAGNAIGVGIRDRLALK